MMEARTSKPRIPVASRTKLGGSGAARKDISTALKRYPPDEMAVRTPGAASAAAWLAA
jgi:hypothetical protein